MTYANPLKLIPWITHNDNTLTIPLWAKYVHTMALSNLIIFKCSSVYAVLRNAATLEKMYATCLRLLAFECPVVMLDEEVTLHGGCIDMHGLKLNVLYQTLAKSVKLALIGEYKQVFSIHGRNVLHNGS